MINSKYSFNGMRMQSQISMPYTDTSVNNLLRLAQVNFFKLLFLKKDFYNFEFFSIFYSFKKQANYPLWVSKVHTNKI